MSADMSSPTNLRVLTDDLCLEVVWGDGRTCRYPFKLLREECRCARCVDEMTGRRILDPDSVPVTIRPDSVNLIGNYALKIAWNDAHDTGLYTWDHLRSLAENSRVTTREP